MRARFSSLVGYLDLRHVALVDYALDLRQQVFLANEWVPNPRLRSPALPLCFGHPDSVVNGSFELRNRAKH